MKTLAIIISVAICAAPAWAQLNEDIRKKMEANQPLHDVIRQAEAAAMEIGKRDGQVAPGKGLKDIASSEDLNDALAQIVATWATAGVDVGKVGDQLQITKVVKDSPADKAGLQVGDQIESVDGKKVAGVGDFLLSVGAKFEGIVPVEVRRGNDSKALKLDLGAADPKKTKSDWNFRPATGEKKPDPAKKPDKGAAKPEKP